MPITTNFEVNATPEDVIMDMEHDSVVTFSSGTRNTGDNDVDVTGCTAHAGTEDSSHETQTDEIAVA